MPKMKYYDEATSQWITLDAKNADAIVDGTGTIAPSDVRNKVDKVAGKQLSTNDYTTTEKNKLAGIANGAQVNTITSVNGKTGAVVIPNATSTVDGLMTTAQVTKLSGIATGANYTTVVDNTISTSTTSALSANQGKIVSDKITVLTEDLGSKTSLNTTNKTNVVSAVNEINTNLTTEVNRLTTHLADNMPHKYKNIVNGKTYKWGFGEDSGGIYFAREEAI